MSFRWPRSGAEILAQLLSVIRLGIYVAYGVAIVCLAIRVARDVKQPAAPLARTALEAGHAIQADDLRTTETDALVNHFLRQAIEANKPITPDMVSQDRIAPPIPIGIDVVVHMSDDARRKAGIAKGIAVRVTRGGETLIDSAVVLNTACDAQTCSILIGLPAAPKFDSAALIGAQVVVTPPAAKGSTP